MLTCGDNDYHQWMVKHGEADSWHEDVDCDWGDRCCSLWNYTDNDKSWNRKLLNSRSVQLKHREPVMYLEKLLRQTSSRFFDISHSFTTSTSHLKYLTTSHGMKVERWNTSQLWWLPYIDVMRSNHIGLTTWQWNNGDWLVKIKVAYPGSHFSKYNTIVRSAMGSYPDVDTSDHSQLSGNNFLTVTSVWDDVDDTAGLQCNIITVGFPIPQTWSEPV